MNDTSNTDLDLVQARITSIEANGFITSEQIFDLFELKQQRDRIAGPGNKLHSRMFWHDREHKCISIYWGGYEYNLDLDRVKTQQDALSIVAHLAEKGWGHTTPRRVGLLIEKLMAIKGWEKFGRMRHPNEAPVPNHDKIGERSKMQPAVRYEVIKRDGYRCRCCGFAVQDGAHLHVDHIVAIANGGKTEMSNLQTLCTVCNLGKGAS